MTIDDSIARLHHLDPPILPKTLLLARKVMRDLPQNLQPHQARSFNNEVDRVQLSWGQGPRELHCHVNGLTDQISLNWIDKSFEAWKGGGQTFRNVEDLIARIHWVMSQP